MKTAVLVIAWKRPHLLEAILNRLDEIPDKRRVYLFSDGIPDKDRDGRTTLKINETRDLMERYKSDHADVELRFESKNLGCRHGPLTAIDWGFDNEEELIILEEDVLPSIDFFGFADKMLATYRESKEIGAVCGNSFSWKGKADSNTFRKSIFFHGWGWASWKDRWNGFDGSIDGWREHTETKVFNKMGKRAFKRFWQGIYRKIDNGKIATAWDYQFQYYLWRRNQRCCVPGVELIEYLGTGDEATHTKDLSSPLRPIGRLSADTLVESPVVSDTENWKADWYVFKNNFDRPVIKRFQDKIKLVRSRIIGRGG